MSTVGGVYMEFAVTATPAPAGSVSMLREIFEYFATGVQIRQSTVVLTNGSYQDWIFSSGSVSRVREIRFTLNGTSCSLFWNLNP